MPGEQTKFASNVAHAIPKALLQRAAELFADALDLDQDLLVRGRGGGEWLVAGSECIRSVNVTSLPGGYLRSAPVPATRYCARRKLAASAPMDFERSLYSARRGSAAFAMM